MARRIQEEREGERELQRERHAESPKRPREPRSLWCGIRRDVTALNLNDMNIGVGDLILLSVDLPRLSSLTTLNLSRNRLCGLLV